MATPSSLGYWLHLFFLPKYYSEIYLIEDAMPYLNVDKLLDDVYK